MEQGRGYTPKGVEQSNEPTDAQETTQTVEEPLATEEPQAAAEPLMETPVASAPETTYESRRDKRMLQTAQQMVKSLGLGAALFLGSFGAASPAEAAQNRDQSRANTTERVPSKAELANNISEYLAQPMFMKACTEEGSVQLLKDLYGPYISQEKNKLNANTAEYSRELSPQASQKLLYTKIGQIAAETDVEVLEKYADQDAKAFASNLYERAGKHGEATVRYLNMVQKYLFPNGFGEEPGVVYQHEGKSVFMPASNLTNQEVLSVLSAAMVDSGLGKEISESKDLNARSEKIKIAIDNGMALVTQGALHSYAESFAAIK